MKVQKIKLPDGAPSWIVIDDGYMPIKSITEFLNYLSNTGKSPSTIHSYANHLKLFWDYLALSQVEWDNIRLNELASFVGWLRTPSKNVNIISLPNASVRKASSINAILGCLASFYQFHRLIGNTDVNFKEETNGRGGRYKSLLHHIYKNKPAQRRIFSLKTEKDLPKTISHDQCKALLSACHNVRDYFLISLLYETGLRIGQALALRHEDIITWDNTIQVKYRTFNENEVYGKTAHPYVIHVSPQLMSRYNIYIESLANNYHPDYVFVDLINFKPLKYPAVYKTFTRLAKKTEIHITPHMLRHTHATELIQFGWDASFVQKRLGHASVQTTIDVYSHIDQQSLKNAYKDYLSKKGEE